ncbi:biofilm regulation diguanylate cyclase SiaD [Pseudomonas sp. MAP12]|uniref:diguanylate cyclase n=1 Tax=Geopseudomonas aromaticivorans TaxID=2849492 RepID=A0ABS6MU84_9GAMM|nr:biofilm regulation diguanylate cyclase SiaD [Pseudomonas aromaticivorans]MBV2132365.1 biofilm regulation diguanylate cyclase SiaD [Pseudomonas aromaticivorans]
MSSESELDELVETLLSDPGHYGHPLREALARLQQQNLDQLSRLERIARISDGYQSLAREQNLSLSERYHRQLRQLEKVARISDRYQDMLRDLNQALKDAAQRDVLTGLANRRLLMERLREEELRSQRSGSAFVLTMIDIDHFKQVNDTWGHEVGDRALSAIARMLQGAVRGCDLCGRWGGEEFLLLLPDTTLAESVPLIERLRGALRELRVPVDSGELSLTASFGVAECLAGEGYSQTLNRADAALLAAKRNGRDRCVLATGSSLNISE